MSDARAIKATFSTWRPVNGRKVLQLVFEVPIEQQGEVLTMLGAPDDKWCAIAVLNLKGGEANTGSERSTVPATRHNNTQPQAEHVATSGAVSKPKQRFAGMPLSQQCGMRCNDPDFWNFLAANFPKVWHEELERHDPMARAAFFVCGWCGIKSRAELSTNDEAAKVWLALDSDYQRYLLDQRYAESIRR